MGRKGSWFSTVKKVFISDSKKDQKHYNRSKLACFGYHHYHEDPEETPITVVPSLPPKKDVKPKIEVQNERNKQFSLVLATAVAAGAAVAAASEAARLKNDSRIPGKTNEEIAAIKIQNAFRGYLAKRSLRGLRGLARLKTLVQGQSVQRQAAHTLQCMQTLSRLQSQVRTRKNRMSEDNQSLHRQQQQKREKSQPAPIGGKWDDSSKSKEQVEAKMLNRQVAAMRREKALAYAVTHQQTWRNSPKSANATFMDQNTPHWGWNWLERWMAARPWEGQNTMYHNEEQASAKSAASHTMSVGEISKLYSQRDQNHDGNNSQTSRALPLTSANIKAKTSSLKVNSWGGDGDSKSSLSKSSEINRRHSFAVSPRDYESLTSSPKVARTKPKVQNPSVVKGTAKKRLSFPASSSGSRRHSVPTKSGMVSNKNVATIPEDKEKVKGKNGGSR